MIIFTRHERQKGAGGAVAGLGAGDESDSDNRSDDSDDGGMGGMQVILNLLALALKQSAGQHTDFFRTELIEMLPSWLRRLQKGRT